MFNKKVLEVRIKEPFGTIGVNYVLRKVNETPLAQVDRIFSTGSAVYMYIAVPFKSIGTHLIKTIRGNYIHKIDWL